MPFNVVAGSDLNNETTNNDRPAGVARNSARQPSVSAVDVRLSRTFGVAGGRLTLLAEGFNVFNRVNVLAVNSTFGASAGPLPSLGEPTLAGDPRQVQPGVRRDF